MSHPARPSPLLILRGNSAAGKSTIAERVQRAIGQGRAARIGQDHLRRELLWVRDTQHNDAVDLVASTARFCRDRGYVTIVEGIFKRAIYGQMLDGLIREQRERGGRAVIAYLDVSLPETLRRHAGKPIAGEVGEQELSSWYERHDVLGDTDELVFEDHSTEDEVVRVLLEQLRAG